jgi:hypothetical protein
MKRMILAGLLLLSAGARAWAQEAPIPMPPPPPPEMAEPGLPPGDSRRHEPPPVERWLEHLKIRNPIEYERLTRLRQENPDAFARELQQRLQTERGMSIIRAHARLQEFFDTLPPQEQTDLLQQLARAPRHGGGPPPDELRMDNPRTAQLEKEVQELARTYRDQPDPDEQERIRQQIKTRLGAIFDQRLADREQTVARYEQRLQEMQRQIEKRRSNRERIIERRLEEVLDGQDTSW